MNDRFTQLLAVALIAGLTTGCDEEPTEDPCEGLANACETDGATRCNTAGNGMESCGDNADGCLLWTAADSCGSRQGCDDSGDAAICECADECETDGEASCDGEEIVTCAADSDGCLYLETTEDCAASGAECDDTGTAPECIGCTDACDAEGETRCDGQTIVTCSMATDGCLDETPVEDCGAAPANLCDDTGAAPACVGCGVCVAPGDYCDLSASPPECLTAGTVAEILEGVAIETAWDDLDDQTRLALEARARATLAAYNDEYGATALADALGTMETSPTADMETNYAAFLDAVFGVTSVTHTGLDAILRDLYVVLYFSRQALAPDYLGVPAVHWDGVSVIDQFPLPEAASHDAYEAEGARLATACLALVGDSTLTVEESHILDHATGLTRQVRTGSFGYHMGGDVMATVHGLTCWAFDLMITYSDFGTATYSSDDAWLDQVNAYFFADLVRLWGGAATALEFQYNGFGDRDYIGLFVGDIDGERTPQLYLILADLFVDRTTAHEDIDEPCLIYSDAERARIWDAFTADSLADHECETSFATFQDDFEVLAAEELNAARQILAGALEEAFPADCAAMTVTERDAIVTNIESATTLGEMLDDFDTGIAGAGDGSGGDVLASEEASLSVIGGRDYTDATHGATWLAEDTAALQAMWDEVRAWVLSEHGFDAAVLPEDITVEADSLTSVGSWGLLMGVSESFTIWRAYKVQLSAACQLITLDAGYSNIMPFYYGMSGNTEGLVLERFLADTLTAAELARMPFYRLGAVRRQTWILGGYDAVLSRFVVDTCETEGTVEWIRTTVAERWGVTNADDIEWMVPTSLLGPWSLDFDKVAYAGIIEYLQDRADTDHGAGTYTVDPFVLQACDLFDPQADDATYSALDTCLTS